MAGSRRLDSCAGCSILFRLMKHTYLNRGKSQFTSKIAVKENIYIYFMLKWSVSSPPACEIRKVFLETFGAAHVL
jgi:hypothetical protein